MAEEYEKGDKPRRLYLSGPISGYDLAERRDAFSRKKKDLEDCGFEVFNPLENGLDCSASTHEHMHRDLAVLTNEEKPFGYIYMMEKWLHSKGCKLEFDVATAIGLEVFFEEVNVVNVGCNIKFK